MLRSVELLPDDERVVVLRPVEELPEEERVVVRPLDVPDELRVVLRVVLLVPEEVRPDDERSTPRVRLVGAEERPTVPRVLRPVERLVTPAPRLRSTLRFPDGAAAPLRDTVRVLPSSYMLLSRMPVPNLPPRSRLAFAIPPRPMVLPRGP